MAELDDLILGDCCLRQEFGPTSGRFQEEHSLKLHAIHNNGFNTNSAVETPASGSPESYQRFGSIN